MHLEVHDVVSCQCNITLGVQMQVACHTDSITAMCWCFVFVLYLVTEMM